MADGTKIEWTDATWNPITGCSVISAGCKNCYAMKLAGTRMKHHPSRDGLTIDTANGPVWNGEVRLNHEWMAQPIGWTRQRMVFVCAHSDLFHPAVSDDWIDSVFGVMWACLYNRKGDPGHVFQVLTKRADRMREYFSTDRREKWALAAIHYGGGVDPDGLFDQTISFKGPHPRIWLGVSVENQAAADERIPLLLQAPAAVRWISAEPLLGSVNLDAVKHSQGYGASPCASCGADVFINALAGSTHCDGGCDGPYLPTLDWVVVGGESGPHARPMHPEWARSLRDQCAAAGVAFLHKQNGEFISIYDRDIDDPDWRRCSEVSNENQPGEWLNLASGCGFHGERLQWMKRIGKKAAGRLLDGVTHDGYPGV